VTEQPPIETDRVEGVDLTTEMQRSYIDYAMTVIVSRALPDVRDGLKPVHRRVVYAMYDGGYRPDRGYNKCSRVVGEVMGQYHPHGDSSIYDALVRLAQPWSLRYPLVDGQGNFGSPGNDPPAAMRYTECRMAPLAMQMVRDIDEETVDFTANYDGKTMEPLLLPSRFPNLLVNGSAGIAVGMATNIPPHNLREVAAGVQWALEHADAPREELLEALLERITGPDFPTGGLIVGRRGIEDAYRTGRGSVTMRAVIDVEEDNRGRQLLVITQLPYQVNPDNLALRIAELVNEGKLAGIADIRDDSSSRTGQRLVIVLKRDAIAKVVLNNLYKHTQLQDTFGCNMVALVDNVPRTLALDVTEEADERAGPNSYAQDCGARALRPAVRCLRPGPGADRSRVGQGHHREVPGQRRPGLPHSGVAHQRAAGRPGEAPPLGAVDRLLQAGPPRDLPTAARPVLGRHQARRCRGREGPARPGRCPAAARQDRGDRHHLLGDQEGLTRRPGWAVGCLGFVGDPTGPASRRPRDR
jgi:hypothetical protein